MNKFFKQKNKGFTLVETLVAISILTTTIVTMMSLLGAGISNTNYVKQKMIATYLAQEGIEYVRNMRDTAVLYSSNGWNNNFKNQLNQCNESKGCGFDSITLPMVCNNPHDCDLYLSNGSYNLSTSGGIDSGFVRKIWMVTAGLGPDEVKVTSSVNWNTPSGVQTVTFSENLFNWIE